MQIVLKILEVIKAVINYFIKGKSNNDKTLIEEVKKIEEHKEEIKKKELPPTATKEEVADEWNKYLKK